MTPTDETLITETLGGRLEAYDQLMQRYERLIYKVAYGYTRSRESALDLTQTVFLKVYRKLGSFRGRGHFKTWLVRIACNEGVSWVRANRRHVEGRESLADIDIPARGCDQEEEAVRRERIEQMLSGLDKLGHRSRTALVLRYFHEHSVREVACVLKCSEGTAKNLLFRGVRRLRQQVASG